MSQQESTSPTACLELRPLLPLLVDDELDPVEQALVDEHLACCPSCAKRVHFERALKTRLRTALNESDAAALPPHLTGQLRRHMAIARGAHDMRRVVVPATVAAGLIGLLTVATSSAVTPIADESVQRHIDDVGMDFASQDPRRIERALSQRLGHAMRVPTFRSSGISLRGARLVRMNSQPAAYLVYATSHSKLSVIAMPDPQRRIDIDDERVPKVDGRPLLIKRMAGFNVVVWRQRDTVYSIVSDLGAQELMHLVFEENAPRKRQKGAPATSAAPPVMRVSF